MGWGRLTGTAAPIKTVLVLLSCQEAKLTLRGFSFAWFPLTVNGHAFAWDVVGIDFQFLHFWFGYLKTKK